MKSSLTDKNCFIHPNFFRFFVRNKYVIFTEQGIKRIKRMDFF